MAFDFRLPDIGEGVAEGEVVQWFVKEGESVREDAPLVSVLTDKANVEIPSPKSGRVSKIHAQVGEKVKVGGLLVSIEVEGGAPAAPSTPVATPSPAAKPPPASSSLPRGPPPTPPRATAPDVDAARTASEPAAPAAPAPPSRVLASPYLRKLAAERGVDLETVRGSGPGGRIVESDLGRPSGERPARSTPTPPPSPAEHPAASETHLPAAPEAEVSERIPIRGIRRVIAEHMAESTHRAAHFTYVEEVDASELVRLRDHMAKHVEKEGVRLSYLPFIVKAVTAGLRAHPHLNATMDDARNELVVRSAYHIGIATAAPDGLLVPVVRNADRKSIGQLAREIQELAEKGRTGRLTRAELTGSTFTITSLGALGGVMATPILNYPEVGILGVHKIQRRPVYRPDGSIGPADLMNLSLSLDHRVIDGYEGARFLASVKSFLEDPHQLFSELA